jgi:hypothetical protein
MSSRYHGSDIGSIDTHKRRRRRRASVKLRRGEKLKHKQRLMLPIEPIEKLNGRSEIIYGGVGSRL